jgi:hypothetical protein
MATVPSQILLGLTVASTFLSYGAGSTGNTDSHFALKPGVIPLGCYHTNDDYIRGCN